MLDRVVAGFHARPRAAGLPNCSYLCRYCKIRTAETCVRVGLVYGGSKPPPYGCWDFIFCTAGTCVLAELCSGGHGVPPLRQSILFSSQPKRVSLSGCVSRRELVPRPTVRAFSFFRTVGNSPVNHLTLGRLPAAEVRSRPSELCRTAAQARAAPSQARARGR